MLFSTLQEDVESLLARRTAEAVQAGVGLVEEEVAAPSRRSNFSITPHPDKDQLIIFGGELFNGSKVSAELERVLIMLILFEPPRPLHHNSPIPT